MGIPESPPGPVNGGGLGGPQSPQNKKMVLSATDKQCAFRNNYTWTKDTFSFEISHFAALILQVDIQTKVIKFQDFSKIPSQGRDIGTFRPAPSTEFQCA